MVLSELQLFILIDYSIRFYSILIFFSSGPQEKIDGNKVSAKRNGGKKKEKGKKKQAGKKSSGNAIPPGVNRKTLAFAERVGSANSQFASKVMKAIYPKIQYNTIISPLSIHTAMSMVLLGARKTTERELSLALGWYIQTSYII